MSPQSRFRRSAAFTLVELLVVIAIIAVLVALTAAGILTFLNKGPEMQTRNDILGLAASVQNFKNVYGSYPPSKLKLYSNRAEYATDLALPAGNPEKKLAEDTIAWVSRTWPNMTWVDIRWDGSGAPWPPGRYYYLEGDQCLVFCLGGIPLPPVPNTPPSLTGFSTNAKDPSFHIKNPATAGQVKGPYFNFNTARLYTRKNQPPGNVNAVAAPFYSYLDPHEKQPYVYFSSGLSKNGYQPAHAIVDGVTNPSFPIALAPYFKTPAAQAPRQYHNPDSFQIIAAGHDKLFGPGGYWNSTTAKTDAGPQGADDMTNFYGELMGVNQ